MNTEEKKPYTFKFFQLSVKNKNIELYDDYFNLNKTAIRDNILCHLNSKQEIAIDESKIGIIIPINKTNDYFLGKYSFILDRNCNFTESRKYSNLDIEPKKEFGTSYYTYFYIDFKQNVLVLMYRSEVKGFVDAISKALRGTITIKPKFEDDWQKKLAEKITEIERLEMRYLNDDDNENFIESITKMDEIKDVCSVDHISLKVGLMSTSKLIKKLSKVNVSDFERFKLYGRNKKGKFESFDFIEQTIHKKVYLDLNAAEISEENILKAFYKII